MKRYKCDICGHIHVGEIPQGFSCPMCNVPASSNNFKEIDENVFSTLTEKKKKYNGSKTNDNLVKAFSYKSAAMNKHKYFAKRAHQEGHEEIAEILDLIAEQEARHAILWFLESHGIGNTIDNLEVAAMEKSNECVDMYEKMAEVARKEGFYLLAKKFDLVAQIEKGHEEKLEKLLENLRQSESQLESKDVIWTCQKCGYSYNGSDAPSECSVCGSSNKHFYRKVLNS